MPANASETPPASPEGRDRSSSYWSKIKGDIDEVTENVKKKWHPSVDPEVWRKHFQLSGRVISPEEEDTIEAVCSSIDRNFHGAMANTPLMSTIEKALDGRGYTPEGTLFGCSVCPDEICHKDGDLPDLLTQRFGDCSFSLGGLAGLPFTGKTGFGAFSHHVPQDGHVFILFAPHVGITPEGEVGYYKRVGQGHKTGTCGACMGALGHVESGAATPFDTSDRQMYFIKKLVQKAQTQIENHPLGKHVGLVHSVYEQIQQVMVDIVNGGIGALNGGSLTLLGGVQINTPDPIEDFFLPMYFKMHTEAQPPLDLASYLDDGRVPLEMRSVAPFERSHASIDPAAWVEHLELSGLNVSTEDKVAINEAIRSVQYHFPGSMVNNALLTLVDKALENQGFDADDVLFGSSLCPDEINHEAGDLPDLFQKRFGPEFNLGGLAGIPFTGITGFGAFAGHVPQNGHIFIIYAPHVGISKTGEVGYYHRDGQDSASTACGACLGALAHVEGGGDVCEEEIDYQMSFIKETVKDKFKAINSHGKGKIVGLTHEIYKVGMHMMHDMMDISKLNGGTLVILGGLQINMPEPMEDFFLPLDFSLHKEGCEPVDMVHLLDEGRMWEMTEQPAHVGGHRDLDVGSPRHMSKQNSPDLGPIPDGDQIPALDIMCQPCGPGAEAELRNELVRKEAELAALKVRMTKMTYAYEARESLMEHMVGMIAKNTSSPSK